MTKSDSEWDQRVLCSDGNCIGIIGADGRCKTCGAPYDGVLPDPAVDSGLTGNPGDDSPADQQILEADDAMVDEPTAEAETADPDWADRILCVDENCIGVVGPNGRCKECGKRYPG